MSRRIALTLTPLALLLPVAACAGGPSTTDQTAYRIDERVTALVAGARAASFDIVTGDGPVTVTEEHRYSQDKPTTAHRVEGTTLRLTESGCGNDDARCEVHYRIRMPAAMSVDITAQAGAVKVDGVAGQIRVKTEAGAVEGRALTSDEVTVKTELGATDLEFTEAPGLISTTTGMGSVELRVPGSTAYAVDVNTKAGADRVKVARDASSANRIQVRTDSGAVSIEPLP
nr:DUF4097 family beta strand repeat-containing protein [uncultured Actinoplanes sp.]